MAISFVNVGTIASGTSGNITPALPASIAAGDILLLVVGAADNVVCTFPGAYTKKVELNSSTNCRLTVAWARATGSDSAPLVTHAAGSSIFGVIGAYRGCKSAGDPFTDAQSQANAGTTTTITAPTITPLNGDFVIFAAACGEGGTNNGGVQSLSGWSGANPTLTERADYPDQGLGTLLCDGGFADGPSTGGATGSRTVTLASTAQATANSVGALLALTQDAGGASFPQSAMLPLTGLQIPGQPAVAPPIGPTQGPDPSTFNVVTPLPITQFLNPLSLVLGARLFPAPQPLAAPATAQTFQQALTATASSTASFQIQVNKILSATEDNTASLQKQVNKILSGTSSTTASFQKQVNKILSAGSSSTATLLKQVNKILSPSSSSTATMQRQTNKILSTTAPSSPSMVRKVLKILSVSAGSTATMIAGKVWALTLSATSSTTATLSAVFQAASGAVARLRTMMGVGQ